MRTPIRTVGAFGGSTEVPIYPPDCLTYGPFETGRKRVWDPGS